MHRTSYWHMHGFITLTNWIPQILTIIGVACMGHLKDQCICISVLRYLTRSQTSFRGLKMSAAALLSNVTHLFHKAHAHGCNSSVRFNHVHAVNVLVAQWAACCFGQN